MKSTTQESLLNEGYLKDDMPYIETRLKDPEFREVYEEEGLKIQISEQIRRRRKAMKLTQAKLAEKIKTDQTVISRIERGHVSVGVDLLQRIAHALEAKITFTLG